MRDLPFFNLAFSQILRDLRERRKLTQMNLAVAIGGSEVAIRRMERGVQTPTTTTLILLARALAVNPGDLLSAVLDRMEALAFAADPSQPEERQKNFNSGF